MPETEAKICLTFDDGPVPGPTEFVLDTLNAFRIKGTFFCIGDNVRKHPEIFARIVNEGHAVGNHTYNHLNGWKTPLSKYTVNTRMFEDLVREVVPHFKTSLFRPPYGRITRSQLKELSYYSIIMWDVLSYDYDARVTPEACLKNTLGAVRNGSIIVFHDSYKARPRLEFALPRLIEHLLNKGFSFHTL